MDRKASETKSQTLEDQFELIDFTISIEKFLQI